MYREYLLGFQLNSLAVRNHEIVCYFKFLAQEDPGFTERLCAENEEFCPGMLIQLDHSLFLCPVYHAVRGKKIFIDNHFQRDYNGYNFQIFTFIMDE
ncbi:hypothetical protein FB479_101137 [Brevibacillus sp. AG162]|nr:hypothetical protein FB479_101137 [Brevibacillus sp. AG162]